MYAPIAAEEDVTIGTSSPALTRPSGIGDKQTVYITVANASGGVVILTLAGASGADTGGFPVSDTETWMLGPILGEDIVKWGVFEPTGLITTGVDVLFLEGDTKVDSGYGAPEFSPTPAVGITWRQLA
jgi:hypothetical protein